MLRFIFLPADMLGGKQYLFMSIIYACMLDSDYLGSDLCSVGEPGEEWAQGLRSAARI